MLTTCLLCIAFFVAGFIDSIAGGGGLITVPALLLLGIPPHIALGTNKFSVVLGSLSSLWKYMRNGFVEKSIAWQGFVSAFIGGLLGSGLAMVCDSAFLGKALVFLLPVGMAIFIITGKKTSGSCRDQAMPTGLRLWASVVGAGILIGFYDGFFGPGTGTFFILALYTLLHMNLVRASGTAKVFNLASNCSSVCVFGFGGVISFALAIPCAIFNILGNQLGTALAMRAGVVVVRRFLLFVLVLLFCTLIFRFILQ